MQLVLPLSDLLLAITPFLLYLTFPPLLLQTHPRVGGHTHELTLRRVCAFTKHLRMLFLMPPFNIPLPLLCSCSSIKFLS